MTTQRFNIFVLTATILCGVLFCTNLHARVCFVTEGDCAVDGGNFGEPTFENTAGDKCKELGYTLNLSCDANKQITYNCPYSAKWKKCCGTEYKHDFCAGALISGGTCNGKHKCVCDASVYKCAFNNDNVSNVADVKKCGSERYPNSVPGGGSCVQEVFNNSGNALFPQTLFKKCICGSYYSINKAQCKSVNGTASTEMCRDSDNVEWVYDCTCNDPYKYKAGGNGCSPYKVRESGTYCQSHGAKYYTSCTFCDENYFVAETLEHVVWNPTQRETGCPVGQGAREESYSWCDYEYCNNWLEPGPRKGPYRIMRCNEPGYRVSTSNDDRILETEDEPNYIGSPPLLEIGGSKLWRCLDCNKRCAKNGAGVNKKRVCAGDLLGKCTAIACPVPIQNANNPVDRYEKYKNGEKCIPRNCTDAVKDFVRENSEYGILTADGLKDGNNNLITEEKIAIVPEDVTVTAGTNEQVPRTVKECTQVYCMPRNSLSSNAHCETGKAYGGACVRVCDRMAENPTYCMNGANNVTCPKGACSVDSACGGKRCRAESSCPNNNIWWCLKTQTVTEYDSVPRSLSNSKAIQFLHPYVAVAGNTSDAAQAVRVACPIDKKPTITFSGIDFPGSEFAKATSFENVNLKFITDDSTFTAPLTVKSGNITISSNQLYLSKKTTLIGAANNGSTITGSRLDVANEFSSKNYNYDLTTLVISNIGEGKSLPKVFKPVFIEGASNSNRGTINTQNLYLTGIAGFKYINANVSGYTHNANNTPLSGVGIGLAEGKLGTEDTSYCQDDTFLSLFNSQLSANNLYICSMSAIGDPENDIIINHTESRYEQPNGTGRVVIGRRGRLQRDYFDSNDDLSIATPEYSFISYQQHLHDIESKDKKGSYMGSNGSVVNFSDKTFLRANTGKHRHNDNGTHYHHHAWSCRMVAQTPSCSQSGERRVCERWRGWNEAKCTDPFFVRYYEE